MTPVFTGFYLLTGATGAIGREIARDLASKGEKLILAVRNMDKANELREELLRDYPQCRTIETLKLDLADEQSVRDAVETLDCWHIGGLKGIINNAGVMSRRYGVDSQGRELTMAVNFCNTRLLVELLKDRVETGGVIVFTTSLTRFLHRRKDYPSIFEAKRFSQLGTYGQSKRMITEYARQLAEELKGRVRVNCADPGIVDTGMISMQRWYDPIADALFRPFIRNPRQGAEPAMRATYAEASGKIYCRRRIHEI